MIASFGIQNVVYTEDYDLITQDECIL